MMHGKLMRQLLQQHLQESFCRSYLARTTLLRGKASIYISFRYRLQEGV